MLGQVAGAILAVSGAACVLTARTSRRLSENEVRASLALGVAATGLGAVLLSGKRAGGAAVRALMEHRRASLAAAVGASGAAGLIGGPNSPASLFAATACGVAGQITGPPDASFPESLAARVRIPPALAAGLWIAAGRWHERRHPDVGALDRVYGYCVVPLSFFAGAEIGGRFARAAVRARALRAMLSRADGQLQALDEARHELIAGLNQYREALTRLRTEVSASPEPELLERAVQRSWFRLDDLDRSLEAAQAAREARRIPLVHALEHERRRSPLDVTIQVVGDVDAVSPRAIEELWQFVGRALANAEGRGAQAATVEARRHADRVVVVVENPADAGPVGRVRPRAGTGSSRERLLLLHGDLTLERLADRFRATAWVPIARVGSTAVQSRSEKILGDLREGVWGAVRWDAAMVFASAWGSPQFTGPRASISKRAATVLLIVAEALWRLPVSSRRRRLQVLAGLQLAGNALLPHRELAPLSGWTGMTLAALVIEDSLKAVAAGAVLLPVATSISYRGRREQALFSTIHEGIAMALPAVGVLGLRLLFRRVEQREQRLIETVEALENLQDVTERIAFRSHRFDAPVLAAAWLIPSEETWTALQNALRRAQAAGAVLARALEDRPRLIAEMAQALAETMHPVPVAVLDDVSPVTPVAATAAARQVQIRRALDLASTIGEQLLDRLPSDWDGRWQLEAVQVSAVDGPRGMIEFAVRPVPSRDLDSSIRELSATANAAGARLIGGFGDRELRFLIDPNPATTTDG